MIKALDADIIVVGAGLVGLSAAISFAELGRSVVLLGDNKPKIIEDQAWDARIYALTPATENWLASLGVWRHMDLERVNDIHAMQLWHDAREAPLILTDSDAHLSKLGVIAENQNLMNALWEKLNELEVKIVTGELCTKVEQGNNSIQLHLDSGRQLSAKLLVAADGANSFIRQQLGIGIRLKAFNQTALVANFSAEKAHGNIARQWFAPHETLALLPLVGKNVSLVWSVSTEKAEELLKLSETQLAKQVEAKSQNVLGGLKPIGETLSFTLKQVTAMQLIANRTVLIGDAAHQVHPMAGQGVNLGYRDVVALQKLLLGAHSMQDIGEPSFLRRYERARKADILRMNSLTSGLDFLFATEHTIVNKLADWGFQQVNKHKAVKELLIKQAVA